MIGDRLGKWVIFKELGRGGMGRVYLAQSELTGEKAAVKVLAAELAREVGFLHRFQRESDALKILDHPNIVRFYEADEANGVYFYAMEYVEGTGLDQIIDEQGRLPWRDVLEIALQVTPALRHVHDHGIIHRDIKPSNLLLNASGQIKLTDFGIAKVFASTHLTATGGIVGTAEYLSPEQAGGKLVGKRSDLYSFGCVLYALLTGRTPFTGNSYVELLHKHRYGQFDRPQKFVVDLPRELDEIVCQLLEKDPEKRPRDAQVLFKQLDTLRAKLERSSVKTSADNRDQSTIAENRADKVSLDALPGPATMMSKLMRAELDSEQRGSPLARFFNRPIVLMAILLLCAAGLVWGLRADIWPPGPDELYQRGAKLMESESLYDMQRAWTDYLDPLETRFPDHQYKGELDKLRKRWNAAKTPAIGEAQRFFQQGDFQRQQGNFADAKMTWHSLIDVFGDDAAQKEWVDRARKGLQDLDKAGENVDRLKSARAALKRAADLKQEGKIADAERILTGLERLYRDDPSAADMLREVKKARE
jgi:serine/threonine-protein kinase